MTRIQKPEEREYRPYANMCTLRVPIPVLPFVFRFLVEAGLGGYAGQQLHG